ADDRARLFGQDDTLVLQAIELGAQVRQAQLAILGGSKEISQLLTGVRAQIAIQRFESDAEAFEARGLALQLLARLLDQQIDVFLLAGQDVPGLLKLSLQRLV